MTSHSPVASSNEVGADVVQSFSNAMYQWTGVWTDPSKTYLLKQRLQPIMNDSGIATHLDLLQKAKFDSNLRTEIIDALTTHETLFFRDPATLELVASKLVPEKLAESPMASFKIWSGGCSSGQEPYSLAMLLSKSTVPNVRSRVRIVATDVSPKVIDRAKSGQYEAHEIHRGLTPEFCREFTVDVNGSREMSPELRKMIDFRVASLMEPRNPEGPFDIILCRNVLIYFQPEDVQTIVSSLINRLKPGGLVILGASEILPMNSTRYQRKTIDGVSVYQKS